jgi:hypothetical protein
VGLEWSRAIFTFLKQNTQGLILLLLLEFYLEVIREDRTRETIQQGADRLSNDIKSLGSNVREEAIRLTSDAELIEKALQRRYGTAANVASLVSTVLSNKPWYDDVYVDVTLEDSPEEPHRYRLSYHMVFTAAIDEFVVALTTKATVEETLLASSTLINRIYVTSDRLGLEETIRAFADSVTLDVGTVSPNSGTQVNRTLSRIPRKDYGRYVGTTKGLTAKDFVLLGVPLQGPPGSSRRLSVRLSFLHNVSDHYWYWKAERPMFLRRITFDCSRFGKPGVRRFNLQPFLGGNDTAHVAERSPGKFVLPGEKWVVEDQGAMILWRDL